MIALGTFFGFMYTPDGDGHNANGIAFVLAVGFLNSSSLGNKLAWERFEKEAGR